MKYKKRRYKDADEQEEVTQYFSLYTSGSVDVFIQMCHVIREDITESLLTALTQES